MPWAASAGGNGKSTTFPYTSNDVEAYEITNCVSSISSSFRSYLEASVPEMMDLSVMLGADII